MILFSHGVGAEVLDGIRNRLNLLSLVIRNIEDEFLLKSHHNFNDVKGVKTEVINEVRFSGNLAGIDLFEVLDDFSDTGEDVDLIEKEGSLSLGTVGAHNTEAEGGHHGEGAGSGDKAGGGTTADYRRRGRGNDTADVSSGGNGGDGTAGAKRRRSSEASAEHFSFFLFLFLLNKKRWNLKSEVNIDI